MQTYLQDIRVNIALGSSALKKPSFRTLIVGSDTAAIGAQIVQSADELLGFGYLSSSAEYKMASYYFRQNPAPNDVIVMRKATATTYVDALAAYKIINNDFWSILIDSHAGADITAVGAWADANEKFLLGATATTSYSNNTFRMGFVVYDKLATVASATLSSSPLGFIPATVPAITDGDYELDIAIDGTNEQLTIALLDTDSWTDIASKIQTALQTATGGTETVIIDGGKIKVTGTTTGDSASVAIADGTIGTDTALLNYIDTSITDMIVNIDDPIAGKDTYPDAALAGRKLAKEPYFTWKWKKLSGVEAVDYSTTVLNTIRSNKGITVTAQSGAIFSNEGFTGSGSYIDIVYGIDAIESDMTLAILQMYLDNENIAIDDPGIALTEAVIRGVLTTWSKRGVIAQLNEDSSDDDRSKSDDGLYMFKVITPLRSEVPSVDRANRKLTGVKFSYTIGGAQHEIDVSGTLNT